MISVLALLSRNPLASLSRCSSAFQHRQFQEEAAKKVGQELMQYNTAIRLLLTDQGSSVTTGTFSGVSWLQDANTCAFGSASRVYLSCRHPSTTVFNQTYSTTITRNGEVVTAITTLGTIQLADGSNRPDLAQLAVATSKSSSSSAVSGAFANYWVGANNSIMAQADNNTALTDWLRTDGSNKMQGDLDVTGNDVINVNNISATNSVTTSSVTSQLFASDIVGIGTTSPDYKLHVKSSTNDAGIKVETTATNKYAWINLTSSGTGGSEITYNNFFRLYSSTQERFRITNEGAVGLGTPLPDSNYKLHLYEVGGNAGIKVETVATDKYALINLVSSGTGGSEIAYNNFFRLYSDTGEKMRVTNTGDVGIGTVNPSAKLHVAGQVFCAGGCTSSSRKLKENITELDENEALIALAELRPTKFTYKHNQEPEVGFIAEDVPSLVAKKGRNGLDAMDIVAVLTKVVQRHENKLMTLLLKPMDVTTLPESTEQNGLLEQLIAAFEQLQSENKTLKVLLCTDHPKAAICNNHVKPVGFAGK